MDFTTHEIESPFQSSGVKIHVAVPDGASASELSSCIFVLPVDRLDGESCGNGLIEVANHIDQLKSSTLCVMPTFCQAPWYANHPTDRGARQEDHFLKAVIPFIEERFSVAKFPERRHLLGFSKSGWGAYSLLLRNPHLFGRAAAWDAPLGQAAPNKYGMSEVIPDQLTLDQYDVWELLKQQAEQLRGTTRLGLFGYGIFRAHVQATHFHLRKLNIPHAYADGPSRAHDWKSGWVPDAVNFLLAQPEP